MKFNQSGMMWDLRRRFAQSLCPLTLRNRLYSAACIEPILLLSHCANPITSSDLWRPPATYYSLKRPLRLRSSTGFPIFSSSFTSFIDGKSDAPSTAVKSDYESDGDDDDDDLHGRSNFRDQGLVRDVGTIVDILRAAGSSGSLFKNKLERCGVTASPELVAEVLSRVRNDWEAAFTFFLWAGKQPDYAHSLREYHSMISILGKRRKFDTAWALVNEMRGGGTAPFLVTPQTLLIMVRKYCAVHDVGKAINTFDAYRRFKFEIGMVDFQNLVSALCRYKNVKDAEHLLFCNKNVFPLNTKSFNIILNGWCNIIGNPREAKRIWREMGERGISRDVVSYASIMSCYSKANNLNEVLKLFNQMKALDIAPDRKAYNAVIHALAKGRLVKEARNLMKTMEEKGIAPNAVTYNSLIMPLCKARRLDEAREVFHEMLERRMSPTVRTYHAFFRILRTAEEVFAPLQEMNMMGCNSSHDTYIMLIRKFCRWRQLDNVFKLWTEMSKSGLDPDRSSYIVLIHGLFLNGKLEEAYNYYQEMKEKDLLPEPKIDEMLQGWVSGKKNAERWMTDSKDNQVDCSQSSSKTRVTSKRFDWETDYRRLPETRRVVRARGFSFWER